MRICLVYDCLFPYTVGGAERWYRNLARAARRRGPRGHLPHAAPVGPRGERGDVPGVRVVAAGPRMALYARRGQRRILPPLVFGAGVLWHLLRHGRRYDVVHTASFPYFSLLAAAVARRAARASGSSSTGSSCGARRTGASTSAAPAGAVGWAVQALCLRVPPARVLLRAADRRRGCAPTGCAATVTVLRGRCTPAPLEPPRAAAGRAARRVRRPPHPREARAGASCRAVAAARASALPELRARIFGDGPERAGGARRDRRARARATSSRRPASSPPSASSDDARRARSAWCCRRAARATGSSSSRRRRAARRACVVARRRTTPRPSSSRRASTASSPPSAAPEDLAAAIVRVHAAGRRAARSDRRRGSRATRAALSLDALARRGRRELRAAQRALVARERQLARCAPR